MARYLLAGGGDGTDDPEAGAKDFMVTLQWLCFLISFFLFLFYLFMTFKNRCGWEVTYISFVETIKYIFEIYCEHLPPATIYQKNGYEYVWLRYSEWLLTCPVILIHLSRIGLHGTELKYDSRTMRLICSDIGTIVMGITAAAAPKPEKWAFFCCGLVYGASTWINAGYVYKSAYEHIHPSCKGILMTNAITFFGSWTCFPILFLLGPEGNGVIGHTGSIIGHCLADLLSKNLWGLLAWYLDYKLMRVDRKAMSLEGLSLKVESGAGFGRRSSDKRAPSALAATGEDTILVDSSKDSEITKKVTNIFEKKQLGRIRDVSRTFEQVYLLVRNGQSRRSKPKIIVMESKHMDEDKAQAVLDLNFCFILFGPHAMRKKGDPIEWWRMHERIFVVDKLSSEMIKPQMELAVLKCRRLIADDVNDDPADEGEVSHNDLSFTTSKKNLLMSMSKKEKIGLIEEVLSNLNTGEALTPEAPSDRRSPTGAEYETYEH